MRKIWFALMVLSLCLIFFHLQEIGPKKEIFISTEVEVVDSNKGISRALGMTDQQIKNLQIYNSLKKDTTIQDHPILTP